MCMLVFMFVVLLLFMLVCVDVLVLRSALMLVLLLVVLTLVMLLLLLCGVGNIAAGGAWGGVGGVHAGIAVVTRVGVVDTDVFICVVYVVSVADVFVTYVVGVGVGCVDDVGIVVVVGSVFDIVMVGCFVVCDIAGVVIVVASVCVSICVVVFVVWCRSCR